MMEEFFLGFNCKGEINDIKSSESQLVDDVWLSIEQGPTIYMDPPPFASLTLINYKIAHQFLYIVFTLIKVVMDY